MKFLSGLAMLLLALFIQIFLVSAGVPLNLALAVLIASAFIFDFWELLALILLSVFILNWQPAPSVTLIAFALIPLAAWVFQKFARSERWIGSLAAIFVGFLIFYLAAAPGIFLHNLFPFFMDVIVGLVIGEAAIFALR